MELYEELNIFVHFFWNNTNSVCLPLPGDPREQSFYIGGGLPHKLDPKEYQKHHC